jgi:hypothetical protein
MSYLFVFCYTSDVSIRNSKSLGVKQCEHDPQYDQFSNTRGTS